jgi:hypothetical protein
MTSLNDITELKNQFLFLDFVPLDKKVVNLWVFDVSYGSR